MTNTDQQAPTTTEEEPTPGPFDGLKDAARGLGKTVLDAGFHRAGGLTDKLTTKLSDFAEGKKEQAEESDAPGPVANAVKEGVIAKVEGENPATAAIKGALGGVKNKLTGGGKGGKGGKQKFTNIVEWIDVGVPVRVAYNQWTEFESWPSFMKKVENVQRNEDEGKLAFKAQVFLLHRSWEQNLIEMVPDDHIVWQSTGQKGYINGGVTFHEIGDPPMTRICVVLEYHPQGVLEKTLNIWRAVGRASRRELKRYVRQVQTSTILAPDEVQGWRAEVRDKKIVRTHDEVVEQEQQEAEEAEAAEQAEQEAPQDAEGDEFAEDEAEPGVSDEEADAAEDATYLDEAGVGRQDEADEDEYPEDEADEGEYPEDEGAEESEGEESEETDEDEGDTDDEYEDEDEEGSEDDEYEDDESEGEQSEGEESDEGAEDEYESDEEGSEDEYEDEDEGAEDEGAEQSRAEDEGNGEQEDHDESSSGTPTPKDVASGSARPTESPRPRRRRQPA